MAAGVGLAAGGELPGILGVGLTAPDSFLLSLKGAAEGAAKVFERDPSSFPKLDT